MTDSLVYVGLGSNLSNPQEQIVTAIDKIKNSDKFANVRVSSLYRTSPMAGMKQPDYINAVISFTTALAPHDLLDVLQEMENQQGRERTDVRWSPRTLDLDILLIDQQQINDARLTVPHPGIYDRNFVIIPLSELDPDLSLPDNTHLSYLLAQTTTEGIEKID